MQQCTIGLDFGQKEHLLNRIVRILNGYPSDKEVLKEMLQNADDAGATEIHFINDTRCLPKEHVFEDSWKLLQGPALSVYNNKPFNQSDIAGIQNLGAGSKSEDQTKTGRYGVGFSCVYHLTDVPTFLTRVNNEEVLCAFDPNCRFVPGATQEYPGRMMKDIDSLRRKFPDVFTGYLEEYYDKTRETLFRFPLRSKEMADRSKLSLSKNQQPLTISVDDVNVMFDKFKIDMSQSLLFLNSVEEISLKSVDKDTGVLKTSYNIKVEMSFEARQKRDRFLATVKNISKKLKSHEIFVRAIDMIEVDYELKTNDSEGNMDTWHIVQRFGYNNKSVRTEDILLLPRAGVAYLKETNRQPTSETTDVSNVTTANQQSHHKCRIFCTLPLPIQTDLPVHINGHFALDHETRSSLSNYERGGCKTAWNIFLMTNIVAPAYCTLIEVLCKSFSKCMTKTNKDLQRYFSVFPNICENNEPYISVLTRGFYKEIESQNIDVLPVHTKCTIVATPKLKYMWIGPKGSAEHFVFFDDLSSEIKGRIIKNSSGVRLNRNKLRIPTMKRCTIVRDILVRCGLLVFACPMNFYKCFKDSSVSVSKINPMDILAFLSKWQLKNSKCLVSKANIPIEDTPFETVDNLAELLKYCSTYANFEKDIIGLPLLVTADEFVRPVDQKSVKYEPKNRDIAPHVPELFMHHISCTCVKFKQ